MIEIGILIAVVAGIAKAARKKFRNGWVWGIITVVSYVLAQFIYVGVLIATTGETSTGGMLVGPIFGGLAAGIVYLVLNSLPSLQEEIDTDSFGKDANKNTFDSKVDKHGRDRL